MINLRSLDRIKTFGNSMFPILRDGDIVFFKPTPFHKININDIVVFQQDDTFVTHRVIYKTQQTLITKGDNNITADPEVQKNNIVGIVDLVKRENQTFKLRDLYLVQSSFYFKEIISIIQEFNKKKIDYVFLKGLPLHLYYEKKHPQKIYADCDILVAPEDFSKVESIFKNKKYKTQKKLLSKKLNTQYEPEISFYSTTTTFPVIFDIHREPVFLMTQIDISSRLYPQELLEQMTKEFLKDKRSITIEKYVFPILSPSHLVVYLALHFFHHNYRGINRLEFISTIVKKENTNELWNTMQSFINSYQINNFVYPVFLLLRTYYSLSISERFLNYIEPKGLLVKLIMTYVYKSPIVVDEMKIRAGIHRFILVMLLSPSSWLNKIQILFNKKIITTVWWIIKKRLKGSVKD